MKSLLKLLSEGWLGSVIGIIGIIIGFVLYLKSQRRSKLAYQSSELTLVGGKDAAFPAEVVVTFNGAPVPQITASRLILWNSGQRTIRGEDIVSRDALRVELPENVQVLKQEILRSTREVTGVRAELVSGNPNTVNVTFDFLDPGDGMVMEVLHSGSSEELKILGTVRGMPKGLNNYGRAVWLRDQRRPARRLLPEMLFIAVGIATFLYGLFRPQLAASFPGLYPTPRLDVLTRPYWPFVVLGTLFTLGVAFLVWISRRRYPSALEPADTAQEATESLREAG